LNSYNGDISFLPNYVNYKGVKQVEEFVIEMSCIPLNAKEKERIDFKVNIYFGITEIVFHVINGGKTFHAKSQIEDEIYILDQPKK
jgi:hypothetical protein